MQKYCWIVCLILLIITPNLDSSQEYVKKDIDDIHIVQFNDYFNMNEHSHLLDSIVDVEYQLVARHNPASLYPSDFALVQLSHNTAPLGVAQLKKSPLVQRVIEQRRYANPGVLLQDAGHGRRQTDFPDIAQLDADAFGHRAQRHRALHTSAQGVSTAYLMGADELWQQGFTGQGVKVAVFDTGISERAAASHFRGNIAAAWEFTDEGTSQDTLGHGTFVSSVIGGQSKSCPGFAPDAEIHSYRVFTSNRVSYTSWFLDAFNHAIHADVDILNLSIGGPDFMDRPFVEKVLELSANNVIVVSAIGNDGPVYGTLNNPADQLDVIGVGGCTFADTIAPFSSRGMTTWELPDGYGRVKPDVVAYSQNVRGASISSSQQCRALSGTSVASPVVAGVAALLASTLSPEQKAIPNFLNPASMKQILIEGATTLPTQDESNHFDNNIFEQGMGKIDLFRSLEILSDYSPRASFVPNQLDFTDCPYMWPYCTQPIYATAMPLIANVTILNGRSVSSYIQSEPRWLPANEAATALSLSFDYSSIIWPYSGYLGIRMEVMPDEVAPLLASANNHPLIAEGVIQLSIDSSPSLSSSPSSSQPSQETSQILHLPIRVEIIPTPARTKRLLFDQYHNLRYPSGYFPRDALHVKNEPFDWNADHLHTNFRELYNYLRNELGYFIEVLGEPLTCFDASHYGTLLIVDSEEEFFPAEVAKLHDDITNKGLSLAVIADWYDASIMKHLKFFDENTQQWWTPATGGANVPALNDLLAPFDIEFGDQVYHGMFQQESRPENYYFASGNALRRFPAPGRILELELTNQSEELLSTLTSEQHPPPSKKSRVPVLGLLPPSTPQSGRIAVFGDSNGFDAAHSRMPYFWLMQSILHFTNAGLVDTPLKNDMIQLEQAYESNTLLPPQRLPEEYSSMHLFSKVLNQPLPICKQREKHHSLTYEEHLLVAHQWVQDVQQQQETSTSSAPTHPPPLPPPNYLVSSHHAATNTLLALLTNVWTLLSLALCVLIIVYLLKRRKDSLIKRGLLV